jgi:hypothetical protein
MLQIVVGVMPAIFCSYVRKIKKLNPTVKLGLE